jgi:catechol 2,3-dioxygenase-like lactoylglutathione lyase family enzyme
MSVKLAGHATVLLVDDVARAADYYRDRLGFEVTFSDDPTHYAFASRDEVWLHFARFKDAPRLPNSKAVPPDMFDVYIYLDDLEALHRELVGRGAVVLSEPDEMGYGMREFRVRDPYGYVLAFGQTPE